MSSPGMRVFTWRTVLTSSTGVYASSTGVRVLLANNVSASNRHASLSTSPSPSVVCAQKNHAPTITCSSPLKAWTETVVWTDDTMLCLSKTFQSGPHQKLFFHLNETKTTRKQRCKENLKLDDKLLLRMTSLAL